MNGEKLDYFESGKKFFNEKNFIEAERLFSEAIDKKCKLNDSFNWKGACYYKLKKYDKAFECYNKSNEINPGNEFYYRGKGLCFMELKQYNKALEFFKKSSNLKPDNNQYKIDIISAYLKLEIFNKAKKICDELLEKNSNYSKALKSKGKALSGLKNYEDAIKCFDEAFQNDPNDYENLKEKGFSLIRLERFDEAIECFENMKNMNESINDYYYCKAFTYNNMKKYEISLDVCNIALQNDPENIDLLLLKGNVLLNMKNYEEAGKYFDSAIKLDINNINCYIAKVNYLYHKNIMDEAIYYTKIAIDRNPGNKKIYLIKSKLHYELNELIQAIQCLDEVIDLDPDDKQALELRGDYNDKLGNYLKAIDDYKKILNKECINDPVLRKMLDSEKKLNERKNNIINIIPREEEISSFNDKISYYYNLDSGTFISYDSQLIDLKKNLNRLTTLKNHITMIDNTYMIDKDKKNQIEYIKDEIKIVEKDVTILNENLFVNNQSFNSNKHLKNDYDQCLNKIAELEYKVKSITENNLITLRRVSDLDREINYLNEKLNDLEKIFEKNTLKDYEKIISNKYSKYNETERENLKDYIFGFKSTFSNIYACSQVLETNLMRIDNRTIPRSMVGFCISLIPLIGNTLTQCAYSIWDYINEKNVKRRAKEILKIAIDNIDLSQKIGGLLEKLLENELFRDKIINLNIQNSSKIINGYIEELKKFVKDVSEIINKIFGEIYDTPAKKLGYIHANLVIRGIYNYENLEYLVFENMKNYIDQKRLKQGSRCCLII